MEETLRDVGGEVEVSGAEEIEEDGEAIWVSVDEKIFFGRGEVPVVVEQGPEEGVATCVREGRRRRFEDSSANVEFDPVFGVTHRCKKDGFKILNRGKVRAFYSFLFFPRK